MKKIVKKDFKKLNGIISAPPDKSISHRAIIFSSLAKGKSIIKNFSDGKDPNSSLNVCKELGINIKENGCNIEIISDGKFINPNNTLDCGNSGTTMRLMSGILAGQNFNSILIGDESLNSRPMKRIIEPLELMGAKIISQNNKAPLKIFGNKLNSINYKSKISSAQVKSCVLLAGLQAEGTTVFEEPFTSRNHTEIMLKSMGADIFTNENKTFIKKSKLMPLNIEIPGDISSASYFIASALIVPNSSITIKNIGLNPTRTGILDILTMMGANFDFLDKKELCGELVGDLRINYSELKACNISGELIPKLIDEIPIIAVLATQAKGTTIISDALDLRNKETDRIKTVVNELKKLGANIKETEDGMIIKGKTKLMGDVCVKSHNDHRLAMSLYVAGLITEKEICIEGFDWVKISFPNFEKEFENIKIT